MNCIRTGRIILILFLPLKTIIISLYCYYDCCCCCCCHFLRRDMLYIDSGGKFVCQSAFMQCWGSQGNKTQCFPQGQSLSAYYLKCINIPFRSFYFLVILGLSFYEFVNKSLMLPFRSDVHHLNTGAEHVRWAIWRLETNSSKCSALNDVWYGNEYSSIKHLIKTRLYLMSNFWLALARRWPFNLL